MYIAQTHLYQEKFPSQKFYVKSIVASLTEGGDGSFLKKDACALWLQLWGTLCNL